jgi:desulfoferrodoxin (superoxide reductase-like protein)
MPVLSIFFGLVIRMYYRDHIPPHIHVEYQDEEALVDILTGEISKGSLSARHIRFVQAWIEIHREDLIANWKLCQNGEEPLKIDPLK